MLFGMPFNRWLSMLTIHNSQPAKESHCCRMAQSATVFGWSRHWSVVSPASMRRPAARQIHWKFWCENCEMWFLNNNCDNKHVVSVVNFLKCVVTNIWKLSCFQLLFLRHWQSSVVTYFKCGGIYSDSFIANCLLILTVEKFWKSADIW